MRTICAFVLMLTFVGIPTFAGGKKPNCKLTVQKWYKSGKKKIDMEEVFANSRDECKTLAREKQQTTDEDIAKITATFGWRDLEPKD